MDYQKSQLIPITTLKNRSDFLRLRQGHKFTSAYFILRYGRADVPLSGGARVGYTVTTKCGNAVVRNRMKRRLRALVKELFPAAAKPETDYIFIAMAGVTPSLADALRWELANPATGRHSCCISNLALRTRRT